MTRMSAIRTATAVVLAGAVIGAAQASAAGWSAARSFSAPRAPASGQVLALDGRGSAAVLWTSRSPARLRLTGLPGGRATATRTLGGAPTGQTALVLDRFGEATAAWVRSGRLYAAHGALTAGAWRAPQRLAASAAADPVLAVASDGDVLLAWTSTRTGRISVARRSRGHGFGASLTLRRPRAVLLGGTPAGRTGVAFDPRRRAWLWNSCDGAVRVTGPDARRFALVQAAPSRVVGLSLSVTSGTTEGRIAWADGRCATDPAAGPTPGPLAMRAFSGPRLGPVQALMGADGRPLSGYGARAVGPALVEAAVAPTALLITLDGYDVQTGVTALTGSQRPLAADARVDVLWTAPYVGLVVRPPSGPEQPFDADRTDAAMGVSPAFAPNGEGFGAVWDPDMRVGSDQRATSPARRLSVSLWTPPARR